MKQRLKLIAVITVGYTLEKTSTPALSVRNVFHLRRDCINICVFIEVNTSVQNVADVVTVRVI